MASTLWLHVNMRIDEESAENCSGHRGRWPRIDAGDMSPRGMAPVCQQRRICQLGAQAASLTRQHALRMDVATR